MGLKAFYLGLASCLHLLRLVAKSPEPPSTDVILHYMVVSLTRGTPI